MSSTPTTPTPNPAPSPANGFYFQHCQLLADSFQQLTGQRLCGIDPGDKLANRLYNHSAVVLSHGLQDDPIFNYGNLAAQRLFAMSWQQLTRLPSRKSAERPNRSEREKFLQQVSQRGYVDNYSGIRIASSGQRFYIHNAVVWNLIDTAGNKLGQAATFENWEFL